MDKENKSMYPKVTTWDVFSVYWVHARKYIIYIIVIFVGVVVGVMLQNIITPIFYKRFFDTISGYHYLNHEFAIIRQKVVQLTSVTVINLLKQ